MYNGSNKESSHEDSVDNQSPDDITSEESSSEQGVLEHIVSAAGTDIGMRREENQDSFGIVSNDSFNFYIVADGMGGAKGGATASKMAINIVSECLESRQNIGPQDITTAVQNANAEVFEKGNNDPELAGMGTTFAGIVFTNEKMYVVNVGDSRVYRIRGNSVNQLTEDHTLVMELLKGGAIAEDQVENHPISHMLTRSLGPTPNVDVDCDLITDGPVQSDKYLICSDGLYNLVHENEFVDIVNNNSLDDSVQKLIDLANQRGGTDNITIVLIDIDEEFHVTADAYTETNGEIYDTLELNVSAEEKRSRKEKAEDAAEGEEQFDSPKLEEGISISDVQSHEQLSDEPQVEQILKDERKTPKPFFSNSLSLGIILLVAVVTGAIGWLGGRLQSSSSPVEKAPDISSLIVDNSSGVTAPVPLKAKVAPVRVSKVALEVNQVQTRIPALIPLGRESLSSLVEDATGEVYNGLTNDEVFEISRRKEELRTFISNLNSKIEAFDKPISGGVADILKRSSREEEKVSAELKNLKVKLDTATRKLAMWYGRRTRMASTDPVNLATEISVSSDSVKEKKEIFERVTWAYLKEAEVLRYNPADKAQEEKVNELARLRKQRRKELSTEIENAIGRQVESTDRHIAELTLKRDTLENKLNNIRKELEFVQVLMSSEPASRKKMKDDLVRDKAIAEAELAELGELLPRNQENIN